MQRAPTHYVFVALLVTAIAIAAGFLASRYDHRFDVTKNARHTLADQTVAALNALDTPVEILAVLGPQKNTRAAVSELIQRYQTIKPDINLEFINPETNPERARSLNAAINGELIIQGNGREQRLQALSERSLTGALRQLARDGERNIAFVVDHEERSSNSAAPSDWGVAMAKLNSSGYAARALSLVSEPIVADDTDLVVIADPRRPYFPGEIAALLQYINRGGNLLWLTDTDIDNPTGAGLNAIALELGIDTLKGVVIDATSQSADLGSPTFVLLNELPRHPLSANLNQRILLPQSKALQITPLAGQNTLAFLQTSESSWTEMGELQGAVAFDENSEETVGPLVLGATIERTHNERTQRIAIIGDADFGSNQFVGSGGNQALVESLIVWLSGDADQLEFITIPAPDSTVELNPRHIIVLSAVWLILVPAIFLCMAGFVAFRRRR